MIHAGDLPRIWISTSCGCIFLFRATTSAFHFHSMSDPQRRAAADHKMCARPHTGSRNGCGQRGEGWQKISEKRGWGLFSDETALGKLVSLVFDSRFFHIHTPLSLLYLGYRGDYVLPTRGGPSFSTSTVTLVTTQHRN